MGDVSEKFISCHVNAFEYLDEMEIFLEIRK